jgi:hypothetical protein
MKKIFYSTLTLLLVIFATACKSSKEATQNTVDEKMTTFFKALEKQDFETAQKLATPATQKLLTVVMEDAKKYKEFNDKPQTIKIEIVDRKIEEKVADYKVRIIIGEKIKEETIHCNFIQEVWYIDMQPEQLGFCRYIVFFDMYDSILVLYKKKTTIVVQDEVIYVNKTHKAKSQKKSGKGHKHKH